MLATGPNVLVPPAMATCTSTSVGLSVRTHTRAPCELIVPSIGPPRCTTPSSWHARWTSASAAASAYVESGLAASALNTAAYTFCTFAGRSPHWFKSVRLPTSSSFFPLAFFFLSLFAASDAPV